MKGWAIFKHSVLLVLRNWQDALKIGLVPILAVVVLGLAIFLPMATAIEGGANPGGGSVVAFLAFVIGAFAVMLNVIVSWHRFVLLEEYPQGWMPRWQGGRVLGYFGRLLLLALLGFVLMVPVLIVLGLFGGIAGAAGAGEGGAFLIVLLMIPVYLFAIVAYYRLAMILPSGAIDQPITLGQAWDKTRGSMGVILTMLFLFIAANAVLQILVAGVVVLSPLLAGLLSMGFTVLTSIVGVSLLTTLYGHYVEGRPID